MLVIERARVDPLADRAEALAAAAFNQRRKMLRRSLAKVLRDPVPTLRRAGIDPEARAENLAPEDYLRLASEVL